MDKESRTELNRMCYKLDVCRKTIKYKLNNPDTYDFFGNYLESSDEDLCDIMVSYEFMDENRWLASSSAKEPFLEFQALMLATGNYLLQYRRALFHGASFIWQDRAWIITAPSGTGKTTQLVNWMKLYADQTKIINGDKTGLECSDDGWVYAHSTPWRGKERIGFRGRCARLGGIILLEQGEENRVTRMDPAETVHPLFMEFITYPETVKQILDQRDILDQMIDNVPVWKYVNLGNERSTEILCQALSEYLQTEEFPASPGGDKTDKEGRV